MIQLVLVPFYSDPTHCSIRLTVLFWWSTDKHTYLWGDLKWFNICNNFFCCLCVSILLSLAFSSSTSSHTQTHPQRTWGSTLQSSVRGPERRVRSAAQQDHGAAPPGPAGPWLCDRLQPAQSLRRPDLLLHWSQDTGQLVLFTVLARYNDEVITR